MAIRNIREIGDETLLKKSKFVKEMTERTRILIDDLLDTMYDANGVGLAASQVGILKRIFVIDIGDGPKVFINPKIIEKKDKQTGTEGCLSVLGKAGIVTRPNYVKITALDRKMEKFELEATGLLARAICHEYDHLDGKLYVDLVEGELYDVSAATEQEEEVI